MAELNGLPVFKIRVNDSLESNQGIDFISFVDYPAIESNFLKFAKEPVKYKFDADKQMVYGAILIPDKPIYRFSKEQGEYYVVFERAEIEKMVRKFQTQKRTAALNYMHQNDSQVKDAVVQEIWLSGKSDKSKDMGFDFPEGTAVVGVHVGDQKFWNEEVKSGNVKGFSIEGWMDMELAKVKLNKNKFMEANVEGGVLKTEAESFSVGAEATFTPTDGQPVPAEGEYKLENGTVIKCEAGKITEVTEAQIDAEVQEQIQRAMQPVIEKMQKAFDDKLEALKVELKNTQGNPAGTGKNDTEPKLTAAEKLNLFMTKKK